MPDYKETATLAKLELALIRQRVDGDFLQAKLQGADVRALAAAVDPDDAPAVEKLAADVLKQIPTKFVKAAKERVPREAPTFTAEEAEALRAKMVARSRALDAQVDHRKLFEASGVILPSRGG